MNMRNTLPRWHKPVIGAWVFWSLSMVAQAADPEAAMPTVQVNDAALQSSGWESNKRLGETQWILVGLQGKPVDARSKERLVLRSGTHQLRGHTACDALAGSYRQRGTQLVLKPRRTSRTSCSAQAEQKQARFLAVLNSVDAYRIEGSRLSLLKGDQVQAQFDAAQ